VKGIKGLKEETGSAANGVLQTYIERIISKSDVKNLVV
jgi:hypothetical protein